MKDVSTEAIADVKSTLKVEFPITGLLDFAAATKMWTFNEKKHTIPISCMCLCGLNLNKHRLIVAKHGFKLEKS